MSYCSTRELHCAETYPSCISHRACVRRTEATWKAYGMGGRTSSGCGLRPPMRGGTRRKMEEQSVLCNKVVLSENRESGLGGEVGRWYCGMVDGRDR